LQLDIFKPKAPPLFGMDISSSAIKMVELADRVELYRNPQHPYTRMLLDAVPDLEMSGRQRIPVAGEVPNPLSPPTGCAFHPRCPHAVDVCRRLVPTLDVGRTGRAVACHVFPADAGA
jgi:peptide/nickel transport system ATP-binding protein